MTTPDRDADLPIRIESFASRFVAGDCASVLEMIYPFLDQELTEESRDLIDEHIRGCTTCGEAFDFEHELRSVVRNRAVTRLPDSLKSRIALAIQNESRGPADHDHRGAE